MTHTLASPLAFIAAGTNFLGAFVLLLFNPRSRAVRGFAAFSLAIAVLFTAQGFRLTPGVWSGWSALHIGAAHALPGLFIFLGLTYMRRPAHQALVALLLWMLLLPLAVTGDGHFTSLGEVLQLGGWIFGCVIMWSCGSKELRARRGRPVMRMIVIGALMVLAPLALIFSLLGGPWYYLYGSSLMAITIQLLMFTGIAYVRLYDIEIVIRSSELAAEAAAGERIVVIGELAATLAHEVRNPLTGVKSLTQQLAEGDVDESKRRRYAEIILGELERVERIVSDLLGLARRGAPTHQPGPATELAPLFEDLSLLVSHRAREAGVELVTETADIAVPYPREVLAQALLNLLLNAIDQTPAGSSVELLARSDGEAATIVVRDKGPGIPEEEREHIFQPFHSQTGGTGLGLAVVRRLASDHGWTISIDDAPGGGAEFHLTLETGDDVEAAA